MQYANLMYIMENNKHPLEIIREYKALKKNQMAKLLGISTAYYSQIVNKTRCRNGVNLPLARKFSKALDEEFSVSEVMGLSPIKILYQNHNE